MTWFKVDDQFPQHPKVLRIPRRDRVAAIGLWTLAGCWCANNLTDGHLDASMLDELAATKRVADHLVRVGLWRATNDGYQFHDWESWQPTRAEIIAKREEEAERKRRWRAEKEAARAARRTGTTTSVPQVSQRDNPGTDGGTPASVRPESALPDPYPTRPDPSLPTEETQRAATPTTDTPRKRATGAPTELPITDAMRTWATAHNIRIDLERETARFLDHHRAKGSTFKDWTAAWRTWMSRAGEYAQPKLGLIRNPEEIHSPGTGWAR